jgi:hypothetical protein
MIRRGEGSMRGFKIEDREDTGMGGRSKLVSFVTGGRKRGFRMTRS